MHALITRLKPLALCLFFCVGASSATLAQVTPTLKPAPLMVPGSGGATVGSGSYTLTYSDGNGNTQSKTLTINDSDDDGTVTSMSVDGKTFLWDSKRKEYYVPLQDNVPADFTTYKFYKKSPGNYTYRRNLGGETGTATAN